MDEATIRRLHADLTQKAIIAAKEAKSLADARDLSGASRELGKSEGLVMGAVALREAAGATIA